MIKRTTKPKEQTKFINPNPIDDAKLSIYMEKKPQREGSFFYAHSKKIAELEYKEWKIYAAVSGDTRVTDTKTKEEIYDIIGKRSNIEDYWDKYDDKILSDSDRFEWSNNNWFSIGATTPPTRFDEDFDGSEYVDLDIATHSYDSAIQAMRDVLETLMEKGSLP